MRVSKAAVVAVAVAAGLSLTACQGKDDAAGASSGSDTAASAEKGTAEKDTAEKDSAQEGPKQDGDEQKPGKPGEQAGNGTDAKSSPGLPAGCKTKDLNIRQSHGMGEGVLVVSMGNQGADDCTLKGFAGIALNSAQTTYDAERSDMTPEAQVLKPGDRTYFKLYYPRYDGSDNGMRFDEMTVTPPEETHSRTLKIKLVAGLKGKYTVDPVGSHAS
jgi:Protein of unknown function (DUF4232)